MPSIDLLLLLLARLLFLPLPSPGPSLLLSITTTCRVRARTRPLAYCAAVRRAYNVSTEGDGSELAPLPLQGAGPTGAENGHGEDGGRARLSPAEEGIVDLLPAEEGIVDLLLLAFADFLIGNPGACV